jgi:hypothetical protein
MANKNNRERAHSLALWLLVAVLLTVAIIEYAERAERSVTQASGADVFVVGECAGGETIYGWGNRGVGSSQDQFGCFDKDADLVENAFDLASCQQIVCARR